MRVISLIVIVSVLSLPSVSFSEGAQAPTKVPPDLQSRRPQVDISQCEKVHEVHGMQLCEPLPREAKVRLPDGAIKAAPNKKNEDIGVKVR